MRNTGTNNNSGVDPLQVIQVKPIMIKQGVNSRFAFIGFVCLFILIGLIFASCSPQKRLSRLVKNHPHLIDNDTIIVHDTITVPSVTYDTTTIFIPNKTVEVINNERVRLHYVYDTITNTITHEVECKEVIINREIAVPVTKYKITNDLSWIKWLVVLGLALVGLVVFLKVVR